jgi:hypothetical protein
MTHRFVTSGVNVEAAEKGIADILGQICHGIEVISQKPSQAALIESLRRCTQDAAQVVWSECSLFPSLISLFDFS